MNQIKEYLKKYSTYHKDLLVAAKDELLPTSDLIEISKEIVVAERNDNDEHCNYIPLMILHLRANEDTLHKSLKLLESDSSIDRELGCKILREFPRMDEHPTKFSLRIVNAMHTIIQKEKNEDVLLSALATLANQGHPEGHKILLQMSSDPRDNVRYRVAYGLLYVFNDERKITEETAKAFLKFTKDSDEDIRASIFYDIKEYPEMFSDYKSEFIAVAEYAKNDSSEDVRKYALSALEALLKTSF